MGATNFPSDKYIDSTIYTHMQHVCEKIKINQPYSQTTSNRLQFSFEKSLNDKYLVLHGLRLQGRTH
jgi:hypothetical protein